AIFDTIAGLVAACVVVPAVFAFGLDVSSGPPLLFITLAQVFQEMPFGRVFAIILFIAVVFAAITSLMNLFEAPVEALQYQFKLPRIASVCIIAIIAIAVGLFIENGSTVSDWMDIISIYVIPVGALLAAIMFFWVCPKGFAIRQAQKGRTKPIGKWFTVLTRYFFPVITFAVIILGIFFGGIG
ncbi:MAG: sodium-dependent transporter, partial [Eggerthellaceae bacterium]|nr:sodium-dependent transporter [Eggerthellaceae bacterium]